VANADSAAANEILEQARKIKEQALTEARKIREDAAAAKQAAEASVMKAGVASKLLDDVRGTQGASTAEL